MTQTLFSTFLLLFFFISFNTKAQVSLEGLYVQEFKLYPSEQNNFTEDITAQYRMLLSNKLEGKKIINRKNPAILDALQANEIAILEDENGKVDIPSDLKQKLKEIGVTIGLFCDK